MSFPAIRIEGAILSPELLERLEDAAGQRPVDFGLEAGARVKDEIARHQRDAPAVGCAAAQPARLRA